MKTLGQLERAVMDLLWAREETGLTAREVADQLGPDRELAYTTVMTVLDRLARKGFLDRERDGRAWRYRPVSSRAGHVVDLMFDALATSGDRAAALVRFAQGINGAEAEVLRRALGHLGAADDPAP